MHSKRVRLAGLSLLVTATFSLNMWAATTTFTGAMDNDWSNAGNWNNGVPAAGDTVIVDADVLLTDSTPLFTSLTVNRDKTMTCDGWDTVINAADVEITGILTHAQNTATTTNALGQWIPNARIKIVCDTFTLASTGKVDVNGKGYLGGKLTKEEGRGPGGAWYDVNHGGYSPGGNHGGLAGVNSRRTFFRNPTIYGDPAAPTEPGSGGGASLQATGCEAGDGGGAVWIAATGTVTLDGNITADGAERKNNWAGGGSGGSVYITCETIQGIGTVSANGEQGGNFGGAGAGGRVAVIYDTAAQTAIDLPSLRFLASGHGISDEYENYSDPGTIYFSDNQFLLRQTGSIKHAGTWLSPVPFTEWNRDSLTLDGAWLRIPTEGFELNVAGDISIIGSRTRIFGLMLTNGVINCGGDITINKSTLYMTTGEGSSAVNCEGDLSLVNTGALRVYGGPVEDFQDPGAVVNVGGTISLASDCWIFPFSHPSNGGSPHFTAAAVNIPAAGSGFNAVGIGFQGAQYSYLDGFGPGKGRGGRSGGGGAGYGGVGGYNDLAGYGETYGLATSPFAPGSGGAGGLHQADKPNYPGYAGGGAIVITTGDFLLNGVLNANAGPRGEWVGVGHYAGGGSGGGIFVRCKALSGNGSMSADGAKKANSLYSGEGGGGRIAVWLDVPEVFWENYFAGNTRSATIVESVPDEFDITASVSRSDPGLGSEGTDGTIVFLTAPPLGTLIMIN